jgi:hypothetical protein
MMNVLNAHWRHGLTTLVTDMEDLECAVGDEITVANVDPTDYNGTFVVHLCSPYRVQVLTEEPGTYVSGGTIQ